MDSGDDLFRSFDVVGRARKHKFWDLQLMV